MSYKHPPPPSFPFTSCHTLLYPIATGDGEIIMKYCPSFKIVDLIRHGCGPMEACDMVVRDIVTREGEDLEMGVIAMDMKVCARYLHVCEDSFLFLYFFGS